LPVRHFVDCASSTMRTGHWRHLVSTPVRPEREAIVDRLLEILVWFEEQRRRRPDKFMYFWEFDLNEPFLRALCDFSGMPFDTRWCSDVLSAVSVEPAEHSADDNVALKRHIDMKLRDYADLNAKAQEFVA
jgi:hypothetical protein